MAIAVSSGMARVARWSIAYRWLVIAGWVLLAVAGSLAAARSGGRLSFAFDLPGQPAYEANTAIAKTFGSGGSEPPLVTVVRLPRGVTVQSPGVREQLEKVSGKAAAALPGARTASWDSTGDRAFVSADGRTTFGLVYHVEMEDSGLVSIDLTLTSPGCPIGPMIQGQAYHLLTQLPGVDDVEVNLVWEPPWDPKTMASEEVKMMLGIW